LWLAVRETSVLRGLHERLNRELQERLGIPMAVFDGPRYRFHATVLYGPGPVEAYQQTLQDYQDMGVPGRQVIRQLALVVGDDGAAAGEYVTYRIWPLKGKLGHT